MENLLYERSHLEGVVALCEAEGWPSYPADPERAHRALTAPGVTAVVAWDDGMVVGFAYLQSDGEIQAHLSNLAVAAAARVPHLPTVRLKTPPVAGDGWTADSTPTLPTRNDGVRFE